MAHYGTCNTINWEGFLECCPMQLPSPAFCVVLSQAANSKLSAAEIYLSIYLPIPFEAAHTYFVYSWLWVFSPSLSVSSPFLYVLPHPWTIYRITVDKTVNGSLFTRLSRDYSPSLWPWLYPAPGHAKRRNPRWSDHGVFKQQHSSLCPSPRQRFVDRDENWSKAVACCRSEDLVHRLSGSHSGKPTWGSVGDFLFVAAPAESYRTMADLWGGWTSQSKFIVRTDALILERRSVVWEKAGSSPSLDIRIMDVIALGADHPHGLHFHVRTVTGTVVCVFRVASRNSPLNSTNITRVSEITWSRAFLRAKGNV